MLDNVQMIEIAQLPEVLQARVQRSLAAVAAEPGALPPRVASALPRVWAASPFVADWCVAHWSRFVELAGQGWLEGELQSGRIGRALDGPHSDVAALDRRLRTVRNAEMVRIAWRELSAAVEPRVSVEELSELADLCIAAACKFHRESLELSHGQPRDATGAVVEHLVLALGKLGGCELNFSSDVDLVFVYGEDGVTDGSNARSNAQFFGRLAQRVSGSLSSRTADGFVFRVDTRLRPFGDAGPPAASLAGMEDYYSVHGREWERYALIKARSVHGGTTLAQELFDLLGPFVYRRYLDYGAIDSLREMKAQIDAQVRSRGREQDIKLGWGGIREVEFLIQVFQLVRGGAEPALQSNSLMAAMDAVERLGLHDPEALARLREAYWFLRRVENCWQAQRDQQTHILPSQEEPRRALALGLGFADWAAFEAQLQRERAFVHAQFSSLFAEPPAAAGEQYEALLTWWDGGPIPDLDVALQAELQEARDAAQRRIGSAQERRAYAELIAGLLPRAQAKGCALPVLRVAQALAGRSNYVALLRETPAAVNELIELCRRSPWLATELQRFPALLGELVDPEKLYAPDEREFLRDRLQHNLAALDDDDDEARLDVLRRTRHAATLRIAAADLSSALPIMRVSDRLSELAEEILHAGLEMATAQLLRRYPDYPARHFAIIAYGKLGGLELGYTSDLDLVFVYQADPRPDLPLEPAVFYTRLAQKLIHCLATPTGAGRAYEVDTRLRPSGASGLLVTPLPALAQYQAENAWTWEHQALIRARPVAGDPELAAGFVALRQKILSAPRDPEKLLLDVRDMRGKMRAELGPAAGQFDPKQSPGGITDIEFFVQYRVLQCAAAHPEILRYTDVCRLLESLAAAALISRADAEFLAESYRRLRRAVHRAFLCGADPDQDKELMERAVATDQRLKLLCASAAAG